MKNKKKRRRNQDPKNSQNTKCTNRENDTMGSVEEQNQSRLVAVPVENIEPVPHHCEERTSQEKTIHHRGKSNNNLKKNKQYPQGSRKSVVAAPQQSKRTRSQENQLSTPKTLKQVINGNKPRGVRNLGNTCYMNAIYQCLAAEVCSAKNGRRNHEGNNTGVVKEQITALLKVIYNTKGQAINPWQARNAIKSELPQFANNNQQDAHEFLMAIIPSLVLPNYQGKVTSVLKCSCGCQSSKPEMFACIEVPVLETNQVKLEECIEKWLAEEEVEEWKCPSCKTMGNGVKRLSLDTLPSLLMIQLKRFRKVGNTIEKVYKRVRFPMEKAVIGGTEYRLKAVTYHSGSPAAGHYTAAVKYDEEWWNCNDALVKRMEDGKVVSESAYILFYKQLAG